MLVDSQQPRGVWEVGVITATKIGEDGNVRTCTIRLANKSEVCRSISKIVLLEAVN